MTAKVSPDKVYRVNLVAEDDGRFIADIPELPGVMAYGDTPESALANAQALAFRVLADEIESEKKPQHGVSFEQVA